jgi:hypothetical protein
MIRAAVLISLLAVLLGVAQPARTQAAEQTDFSAEEESVSKPAVLPPAVKQILADDRMVSGVLKYEGLQELPDKWLAASIVHLDGLSEMDLLVEGEGPLRGANVNSFWIFRPTSTGFIQILYTPAHDLTIKRSRARGYRDIEIVSLTAMRMLTAEYKFDGNEYKLRSTTNRAIR